MDQISISDNAATRIQELLNLESDSDAFRIVVDAGGCNGFQYKFDFGKITDDDLVFEKDGAKVAIDDISLEYLKGSELDFVKELGGQFFKLQNPNAESSCGCGSSFSV